MFAFARAPHFTETRSPYAVEFSAIQGADMALAGLISPEKIGVTATDTLTLVFTLSEPDDDFIHKLALPGAMPCDEEFFLSTGGSYGLTSDTTLSSGSFYLYNWTSGGLFLRRDVSGGLVDSLRLVQNTGSVQSAEDLILNERCTAALDTSDAATSLRSLSYSDTTWCLLFNTQNAALSSTELRQALASAARQAMPLTVNTTIYATATGLIPDGLTVGSVLGGLFTSTFFNNEIKERNYIIIRRAAAMGYFSYDDARKVSDLQCYLMHGVLMDYRPCYRDPQKAEEGFLYFMELLESTLKQYRRK